MNLWEKEIKKNPKNADAWYNYYKAIRYASPSVIREAPGTTIAGWKKPIAAIQNVQKPMTASWTGMKFVSLI